MIETGSKSSIENQIGRCLDELVKSEDFDIDYMVSPFRTLVPNPNIASLYMTAFVVEKLINHRDVIDVYGSDEDIYHTINKEISELVQKIFFHLFS